MEQKTVAEMSRETRSWRPEDDLEFDLSSESDYLRMKNLFQFQLKMRCAGINHLSKVKPDQKVGAYHR